MLLLRDKIHFLFNEIDGYNKAFNYVISSRDVGKSTTWILDKAYANFKRKGKRVLIVNRNISDISDQYILSIQQELNKFIDEKIIISYKVDDLRRGIIPLYIAEDLFGLIVCLSISVRRIKQLKLKDIGCVIFDEFICNPKYKEKYLANEVEKFKECYNTFRRCYTGAGVLKCYFMGNPYTRYNPYFLDCGVDLNKIKQGTIIAGDNWVIQSYKMSDELYAILKEKNPLYSRDDAYTSYALGGESVNDSNIRIKANANNYKLFALCEVSGRRIGIFRNNNADDLDDKYHCMPVKYDNINRDIYVFNIEDLLSGDHVLFSQKDSINFVYFRLAYRRNKVTYSDIATYYDIKEIYTYI